MVLKRIRTNIYKRYYRNGRAVWMVRWWDEKQGRYLAKKGGDTKDEARYAESLTRDALFRGEDPHPVQETVIRRRFYEYCEDYTHHTQFLNKSEKNKKLMLGQLNGPIKEGLGNKYLDTLKRNEIISFYQSLIDSGLTHSTLKRYHFVCCIAADFYVYEKEGRVNPFRQIKDFRTLFPRQAPTRHIGFLTQEDMAKTLSILKQRSDNLVWAFLATIAYSGMRRSEVQNLKWEDVDLQENWIYVRKSKNTHPRTIPLEPEAKVALLSLLPKKAEYIFVKDDGERRYESSYLKPLKQAAKLAKVEKRIDIHMLRHSFGSNKVRAGWGIKKVSKILGHSDVTITAKVYTHLLDGDLKVSDEFRFDNKSKSEMIDSQMLAKNEHKTVTKSLEGPRGTISIEDPRICYANATQVGLSDEVVSDSKQGDSETLNDSKMLTAKKMVETLGH